MSDFTRGQIITNGSSAGKVVSTDAKGVKIENIRLNSRFGGNAGMTQVLPPFLLSSWHVVNVGEWFRVIGAPGVMQRYVWSADYSYLSREVERREPAA